ncbi:hypothetical protein PYCC9005_003048 [Savitreella phatthalungensis]
MSSSGSRDDPAQGRATAQRPPTAHDASRAGPPVEESTRFMDPESQAESFTREDKLRLFDLIEGLQESITQIGGECRSLTGRMDIMEHYLQEDRSAPTVRPDPAREMPRRMPEGSAPRAEFQSGDARRNPSMSGDIRQDRTMHPSMTPNVVPGMPSMGDIQLAREVTYGRDGRAGSYRPDDIRTAYVPPSVLRQTRVGQSPGLVRPSAPQGTALGTPFFGSSSISGDNKTQIRQDDVGILTAENARRFTRRLKSLQELYGEEKTLRGLKRSLINEETPKEIVDWFDSIIASTDEDAMDARRTVEGWCWLIENRYAPTVYQGQQMLEKIKFNWRDGIMGFTASVRAACVEASITSPSAITYEIVRRLPDEYQSLLHETSFTSVEQLEKELRRIDQAARKFHNLSSSSGYHQSRATGTEIKAQDNAQSSGKPRRACHNCGKYHWYSGPNATPCDTTAVRSHLGETQDTLPSPELSEDEAGNDKRPPPNDNTDSDCDSSTWFAEIETDELTNSLTVQHERNKSKRVRFSEPIKHEVVVRPIGSLTSAPDAKQSVSAQVKVAHRRDGVAKWKPLDGGSAISIVSEKYLNFHYPKAKIETKAKKDRITIKGVVPGVHTASERGVNLDIWLLTTSGYAKLQQYFHIISSLNVGIILGQDLIRCYGMVIDGARNQFEIPQHRLVGPMKSSMNYIDTHRNALTQDYSPVPDTRVRMAKAFVLPPLTQTAVPVKMPTNTQTRIFPVYQVDSALDKITIDGESIVNGDGTGYVPITNHSNHPKVLGNGEILARIQDNSQSF